MRPSVLVLEFSAVPAIEYTGLKELTEFEEEPRESGVILWLAALNPSVFDRIEHSSLGERLGHERMFLDLPSAVERYRSEYDG